MKEWPGVVVSVSVQSLGQIDLFKNHLIIDFILVLIN